MWVSLIQSVESLNRMKRWRKGKSALYLNWDIHLRLPWNIGSLGSGTFRFRLGLEPQIFRPFVLWITLLAFPILHLADSRLWDLFASIICVSFPIIHLPIYFLISHKFGFGKTLSNIIHGKWFQFQQNSSFNKLTAQNNFNIVSFTFLICLLPTVSLKVSASKADGSVIQPWVWNSKNSDCHIVGTCYRLNVSPQNSYVDISSIIVIGDEASGRWLSQESRALRKKINALKTKHLMACPFFLPCEDTMILWLSMNQEVGSNQTPNVLAPWSWTVRPESCKEEMFVIWVTQPMVF